MGLPCYNENVIVMNNKGFTLIELLSVIAIIAVLGIVFTVNYTQSIKDASQKKCDMFVKELEDAACTYAGLSPSGQDPNIRCAIGMGICTLSVTFLNEQGLIKSEIDPCTEKNVDELTTETVTVSWDNSGKKTCNYNGVRTYAR
jgi:prepilin-type N-terminal cleavage/methylation domain-containing protein